MLVMSKKSLSLHVRADIGLPRLHHVTDRVVAQGKAKRVFDLRYVTIHETLERFALDAPSTFKMNAIDSEGFALQNSDPNGIEIDNWLQLLISSREQFNHFEMSVDRCRDLQDDWGVVLSHVVEPLRSAEPRLLFVRLGVHAYN